MFTRRVIMNIKPGSAAEAGRIFEDEVIPPLRGRKGMRHDDAFISPQLSEALISLAGVLDGAPTVETFNVSSATFRQITAPRREAHRASTLGRGGRAPARVARQEGK
jgi:hypothetical protein